jgi:hypothetical protein
VADLNEAVTVKGKTPVATIPAGCVCCANDLLRWWHGGSWLVGGGRLGLVVGAAHVARAERRGGG